MLARIPDCGAVFAANDHTALGIMRAMAERGRSIPGDVSLVGFDDVPESGFFTPPLTTVRQEFGEVGRAALRLLVGPDAYRIGTDVGRQLLAEDERHVELSRSTAADDVTPEQLDPLARV